MPTLETLFNLLNYMPPPQRVHIINVSAILVNFRKEIFAKKFFHENAKTKIFVSTLMTTEF
jgi:hypothetical protein